MLFIYIIRFLSSQSSLSFPNWTMISFLAIEARVKQFRLDNTDRSSGDRPALSLFSPCKQILTTCFSFPANGSSQRVMKGFLTSFHIWIFFIAYAWLWLLILVLTVMKTRLVSWDSKFAPWLGNCLFWFADKNISKSGKALDCFSDQLEKKTWL